MLESIVEILIDASGSMGYMKGHKEHEGKMLIDGRTRMSIVKDILIQDIVPIIEYSTKVIVRTFRQHIVVEGEKIISQTIETPGIYSGAFNQSELEKVIRKIDDPGFGGTPIAAAIDIAVQNLQSYPTWDRRIILLTDGEENCDGDYVASAKKATSMHGIPCKIFVVGLAHGKEEEAKAKEIATGFYVNLGSAKYSSTELKLALAPMKTEILRDGLANLKNTFTNKPIEAPEREDNQESAIQKIAAKIESVQMEEQQANTILSLENLEIRIREQIATSGILLAELAAIRDQIRNQSLIASGIDSTTLTIDSDYSESIRSRSEAFLYAHLCQKYTEARVKWLNKDGESHSPHDFEVLDESGNAIQLIDCKGTAKEKPTFYLTKEEWGHFLKNRERYQIYRVFNVEGEMRIVPIENLFTSLMEGKVVPYLLKPEILKEGRVFLTLLTGTINE